ncbi:ABC transporter [Tumebacillus algifaecis]|uniref:ABC transporter n=1 Tax=Tumebacillus algifaecis TaxID=1214604 RepID=A0A223CX97_9BACL|nr:ABC transporter ATP-binding protein [Tumebacillus algifaecis]ASS73970.1 ABC transporter [Tumebacillus algifaecis]
MSVKAENVSFRIGQSSIIRDITLQVSDKKFVGLIGPNGCGKSTLLKMIYRVLRPDTGTVYLDNEELYRMPARSVFQRMAVVSQESTHNFDFSVQEIVMMGRTPHKGMFQSDTVEDLDIVEQALSRVDMTEYAKRSFMSLSGGEKQRVLIARALAQQAEIIVLDEPTNHLDIRHQLQLMDLVKTLDITVLAALHDLNLASVYCDELYVVRDGSIVVSGPPEDVMTPELLREIFGVEAEVTIHHVTGKPHITFLPNLSLRLATAQREE